MRPNLVTLPPVGDLPAAGDRCLSVRQPWAALILAGVKLVENRTRPTRFRGRLWVQASARAEPSVRSWSDLFDVEGDPVAADEELAFDEDGVILPALVDLPTGAIVGSVELYDCVTLANLPWYLRDHAWASGPWCWLLRDPRPLATPLPARGQLGMWRWREEALVS